MAYQKALLCAYDAALQCDDGEPIEVQFNPESYSISATGSVDAKKESLGSQPSKFIFQNTEYEASSMSVELLFDSYRHGAETQADVRKMFTVLHDCIEINPEKHTAMALKFAWNSMIFVGALSSLRENYTMFADDGTPVRAKLSLELRGCLIGALVGKPNESPDRTKLRTVFQRDTLWRIAQEEYGSWEQWRVIALANEIDNPRKPEEAAQIIVPVLPRGKGGKEWQATR